MGSSDQVAASGAPQSYQNVIVMRHGDRLDNSSPLWAASALRPWDPPLDDNGKVRAFRTGEKLRDQLGVPIHRVFVSPFLRCLETAAQAISALCSVGKDSGGSSDLSVNGMVLDPSRIKVSVEFGLSEMLNTLAIRASVAPKDGRFSFNISQCEAVLPAGTVDNSVELVYKEVPKWQETLEGARARYVEVIKKLAEKYPSENLLLVTHGEGVGSAVSRFIPGVMVCDVEYCAYSVFRRPIVLGANQSYTAGGDFVSSLKDLFGVTIVEEPNNP
ncbi:uncharacterized protein LOC127250127 [Andrographis paniculata]|uniref:uncharacterized protein LOC127250127 n=1 Tax=Andrographis paniculata TaxID=175694 RepID=UPI0021E95800|nr:uncharacterized protein LOC127250127 [Andrographis paniculata]